MATKSVGVKKYGPMKKKPGQKGYKIEKTMREYGTGALHSGSKKGPKVRSRKQAVAIGLSEERKQRAATSGTHPTRNPKTAGKQMEKASASMTKAQHRRKRSIGRS